MCPFPTDTQRQNLTFQRHGSGTALDDPFLYKVTAELYEGDAEQDEISARFGCRKMKIDPDRGFFLNGRSYPLRGVSRHQDRAGVGMP